MLLLPCQDDVSVGVTMTTITMLNVKCLCVAMTTMTAEIKEFALPLQDHVCWC